jgi:hypothetical protein
MERLAQHVAELWRRSSSSCGPIRTKAHKNRQHKQGGFDFHLSLI